MSGETSVYATRLLVADFAKSLTFYHDLLRVPLPSKEMPSPPYGELGRERILTLFERGRMAEAVPLTPLAGRGDDRMLLAFQVLNVDAEYDRLRALGVDFVAPPTDRPDWRLRSAHLRDPDGNLVELFHRLPARR